jgi:hypothetical protein
VVAVGAVGIVIAHHPMVLSGLRRVQTDLGDTRFNHYLLEHAYRWLAGYPGHRHFWTPPFFFPEANTAAYSDVFLGVAPIYGAARLAGLPPDTAFQAWMMAMSALNYLVALHLLRRRLRLGLPAACAGAFLFAFGAPRINQLSHQQLLPQFLGLIAVDALLGIFAGGRTTAAGRAWLWVVAALGLSGQFYAGFYLGWFLLLAIGVAGVVALGWPSTRGQLLAALRRDAAAIGLALVLGGLLLTPLVSHYRGALGELGVRQPWDIRPFFIDWTALFYTGPENWAWGWTSRLGYLPPDAEAEKRLGVGLFTTAACVLGLFANRRSPPVRLLSLVALVLFLCVASVPGDVVFPGAAGVVMLAVSVLLQAGREDARPGWQAPAVVLAFVWLVRSTRLTFTGIGLFTLIACLTTLALGRGTPRSRAVLAAEAILFALFLFDPGVMAVAAVMGGLVAAAAAVLRLRPYRRVATLAVAVTLTFACLTTFENRPVVLVMGALAPACLAATSPLRGRLAAAPVFRALLIALAALYAYRDYSTAWFALAPLLPGASALRAISRVGMMFLVLWAIGLGLFVQAMIDRRRPIVAGLVVVASMLEQGVTTPSYDRDEHRSPVAALARQIDPRASAFYACTRNSQRPLHAHHLDAMWAGMERGVPTVNGYSGNYPRDWYNLYFCHVEDDCELYCLDTALLRWLEPRGVAPECIDWIGGPEEWRQRRALCTQAVAGDGAEGRPATGGGASQEGGR